MRKVEEASGDICITLKSGKEVTIPFDFKNMSGSGWLFNVYDDARSNIARFNASAELCTANAIVKALKRAVSGNETYFSPTDHFGNGCVTSCIIECSSIAMIDVNVKTVKVVE